MTDELAKELIAAVKDRHVDSMAFVTTSQIIYKGPALIGGITITGRGGVANAQVYDGESSSGRQICDIAAIDGTSFNLPIADHVDVDNGIYVVIGTDKTKVSIHYHPESYKKFI